MQETKKVTIDAETTKTLLDNKLFRIPGKVFMCTEISASSKLLYSVIFGLCCTGSCWATNEYFSRVVGLSIRQVQNCLKELKDINFISIREDKRNRYIMANITFEIISPKNGSKINEKDFVDFGGFNVL